VIADLGDMPARNEIIEFRCRAVCITGGWQKGEKNTRVRP
jgi:hypothetical protein